MSEPDFFSNGNLAREAEQPQSRASVAPPFKVYANPQEVAQLSAPSKAGGGGIWTQLENIATGGAEGGELREKHLSQLLWSGAGYSHGRERNHLSSHGLSSIEAYVAVLSVERIFPGVYHYNPKDHSLEQLANDNPTETFSDVLVQPTEIDAQAAVVVFTGMLNRHRYPHGTRAYRYLLLEAGAAAQATALAATALGLAVEFITDFYDDELISALKLRSKNEMPLCVLAIGR